MSWPYTPAECPRCRYFTRLDPPAIDDAGYELPGLCYHPRIAMDLFRLRDRNEPDHCDWFRAVTGAAPSAPRRSRGADPGRTARAS